ncbi:MAG TPA: nucleotide disphospho-sugar-binding domain-containing protein [Solirubrobacteraceae bacterium]|nr:nucleotide disphospho-sugar-binding domain-containing protein [Solirubrobacteraceae bacterium]
MRPRRILLGAFGDPGHAFPMIALGVALRRRGHQVTLQTWERWRTHVQAEGLAFAPAPEYHVFPNGPEPLDFYEAVIYATRDTEPLLRELAPEVVVSDILTLAPALCAELHGVPLATLIPHIFPESAAGFPIYSFGARLPRTAAGRALWRHAHWPVRKGLESGRAALNRTREQLGLPPQSRFHGGTSEQLALVGSFPQLEYPRRWPAHVHVVGPLMWEPPGEQVVPPTPPRSSRDGSDTERPVVLIAPSTSQDPEHRLLLAALKGLADAPVRVIATWNKRLPPRPLPVPENATVVDWVSYSKTMPLCDLVVCHAGHGTLARALSNGCPVIACPVAGDMNENAARVAWSGAGMRLPRRFIAPRPLRLAVERAVGDEAMRASAQEIAAWAAERDPADEAAALVEQLAETTAPASGPLSATAH